MVAPSGTITPASAGHLNQYFNGAEVSAETILPLGFAACIRYSKITIQIPLDQICILVTDRITVLTLTRARVGDTQTAQYFAPISYPA
jgi:hypothetical protein